jgi:hypothetical protein
MPLVIKVFFPPQNVILALIKVLKILSLLIHLIVKLIERITISKRFDKFILISDLTNQFLL